MFNTLFSQILGGLGGAAGGGAGAGTGAVGTMNPFSGILGSISKMVGGPASTEGTLMSLPGEILSGIEKLPMSTNILGDVAGLAKPVMNLGDKALGGLGGDILSGLNPFSSEMGGSGRLGGIIPYHYLPFLGIGAAIAALQSKDEEENY
jgi:hypothetical protein